MAFLGPLLGGLFGGLLNSGQQQAQQQAGQQAAAAQTEIADTQRQIVNALLQQYGNVFQPLQTSVGGQYQQAAGLPTIDTARYVTGQLLNPNAYRDQTVQSILHGSTQSLDDIINRLGGSAGEGQIAGVASGIGESAVEGISQANIAANQQQDQRNQAAMAILSSLLGGAGQFSGLGTDLTGQASANLQGLGNMYGAAAGQANANLNAMGSPWQGLQGVLQNMAAGLFPQQSAAPAAQVAGFGFDPNTAAMGTAGGNQGFVADANPLVGTSSAPFNPNPSF